jgi:hypothetical protein
MTSANPVAVAYRHGAGGDDEVLDVPVASARMRTVTTGCDNKTRRQPEIPPGAGPFGALALCFWPARRRVTRPPLARRAPPSSPVIGSAHTARYEWPPGSPARIRWSR